MTAELTSDLADRVILLSGSMTHGQAVHMAVAEAIGFGDLKKSERAAAIDLVSAEVTNRAMNSGRP